jgi:LysR family transcriptional regulator, nitrogen assimilation regulatory protein
LGRGDRERGKVDLAGQRANRGYAAPVTSLHKLAGLRVGDVMIFLSVTRCGTVNGAARELGMPGSQVSKAVGRLEDQLGLTLLIRSTRGVVPSDQGARLLPQLQDVVRRIDALDRRDEPLKAITIAAPSYLASTFVPAIARARGLAQVRVRAMEMPPALIRGSASAGMFDVCLTVGLERLPESWSSTHFGELRRGLFATPALRARLGAPIDPAALREIRFVVPSHQFSREHVAIDDGCPLSAAERTAGHEAHSIAMALELAAATDQLVYGPVIAARKHVERGELVELEVTGWDHRDPVFLSCNIDRISTTQQREIIDSVRATLDQIGPIAPA